LLYVYDTGICHSLWASSGLLFGFNHLNAELNPICHMLALLGAHHIPHVSRIGVKSNQQTRRHPYKVINTSVVQIQQFSPDDGHMNARNMYRREINKYFKQNCAPSWIYLRGLNQGVLYCQNVVRFHGTRVNEI